MSYWRGDHPLKVFFRTCYEEGLRLILKAYFRTVHRISLDGMDRVPAVPDKLIVIANHASYLDGLIVWAFIRLPFRIIVDRTMASKSLMRPFLNNRYTVPIDFMNPYAMKDVVRMVNEGMPLLIFPEGRRTSTGNIMKIYDGAGFIALKTGASILPIYLKNTYETFFSRPHKGRRIFAPISMTVGAIRPPIRLDHLSSNKKKKETATAMIYGMLCDLYVEVRNRPSTLGREFVRICRKNGGRSAFDDSTGTRISYRKALIGAIAVGRFVLQNARGGTGILLPNLSMTAVVFMGLQIYRKTTVMLNYSAGPRALGLALQLANIGTIVTSRQFLEKIKLPPDVFDGMKMIYLEDLKAGSIGPGARLHAILTAIVPGRLAKMKTDEEKETAVILFTSGSEGVPKGVCLSHENIITNVYQGLSQVDVTPEDQFLNVLPLFHSFGLTVGTIIPLFAGAKTFFHMSPLQYRIVPELAYDRECTVLLATNTFLFGYGRRGNPYDFRSVRYIFCGGEALTEAVFDLCAKRFGIRAMSGYGTTECAPMVSINNALHYEHGTTGAILPGIDYKLAKVEGIDDKDGTIGRLLVRGKNVMKGYLGSDTGTLILSVDSDGFYDTGDVVEITAQGSLRIIGRVKRFAKVSGEMISLSAVEDALARTIDRRKDVAVIAVDDDKKGEALIVVTNAPDLDRMQVRGILKNEGFSELASPKNVLFLKEIPKLGTGKTDYGKIKEELGL
jgi:acyl-[acyl-carrier-protein]-phospholipid O-acyltransferase/long-chain-fatty-acid--[acyl-carrier-protein] ligase